MTNPPNTILGMRVDSVQMPEVVECIASWIRTRNAPHIVTVNTVNTVMLSRHDDRLRQAVNDAALSLPDGMPLVWVSRMRGDRHVRRVCGPDLILALCEAMEPRRCRHYFYGGGPAVAEQLSVALQRRFPGLLIAGTCSPPFRPLSREEDERIVAAINSTHPDIVWVGLGCPKQELWMHQHRHRIQAAAMIGVGQVFDLYAGKLKRAPRWMCNSGFEWLFRLSQEPRRLWRRYLLLSPQFVFNVLLQELGVRPFE